jgi:hypothetical protein
MWTLQIIEPFYTEEEAKDALRNLNKMSGFLGGTYICKPDAYFHVQAFFRADKPSPDILEFSMDSLPDGAKHVFVPPALQRWYGFTEAK